MQRGPGFEENRHTDGACMCWVFRVIRTMVLGSTLPRSLCVCVVAREQPERCACLGQDRGLSHGVMVLLKRVRRLYITESCVDGENPCKGSWLLWTFSEKTYLAWPELTGEHYFWAKQPSHFHSWGSDAGRAKAYRILIMPKHWVCQKLFVLWNVCIRMCACIRNVYYARQLLKRQPAKNIFMICAKKLC